MGDKVSKIFKYEAGLENIIGHVLQDVGLKFDGQVKLPVVNNTSGGKIVPTNPEIEAIREFYAEDFEAFGYETLQEESRT